MQQMEQQGSLNIVSVVEQEHRGHRGVFRGESLRKMGFRGRTSRWKIAEREIFLEEEEEAC